MVAPAVKFRPTARALVTVAALIVAPPCSVEYPVTDKFPLALILLVAVKLVVVAPPFNALMLLALKVVALNVPVETILWNVTSL